MTTCRLCGIDLLFHKGSECPDPKTIRVENKSGYVPCEACNATGSQVLDEPSALTERSKAVVNCPTCHGRAWVLPAKES